MVGYMRFKSVDFGKSSAEEELDDSPELIKNGFYDYKGFLSKLLHDNHFLVLGNKGSGKSIIGEHINLAAGVQPNGETRFVTKLSMKDFPYKSFSKMIPGNDEKNIKYAVAWQYALLVRIIISFNEDLSKVCDYDSEFNKAVSAFVDAGILPAASLSEMVKVLSKKSFKLEVFKFNLIGGDEKRVPTGLMYSHVVEQLFQLCSHLQSDSFHYIIIDGLDEQLSERNNQFESVMSLIQESKAINTKLKKDNVNVKILVLCRKDVFDRLPGTNKNKLRSSTVNLDWYEDQVLVENKNIIKMTLHRAAFSGYTENFFRKEFQDFYPGNKCAEDYLLENTRHTPRDLVNLLSYVQEASVDGEVISPKEINKAVKKYSVEYFWPEIEDELDGYFDRLNLKILKKALIHFNKTSFMLNDFSLFCDKNEYFIESLENVFLTMYDCGAVSNRAKNSPVFFSKTKDGSEFNRNLKISINRGAWKALGLSFSGE